MGESVYILLGRDGTRWRACRESQLPQWALDATKEFRDSDPPLGAIGKCQDAFLVRVGHDQASAVGLPL